MLTLSINLSLKMRGGELFNNLFENIMSLDFPGLKVTFHLVAHSEILSRSLFKISAVSVGSETVANNDVSSAKIKISFYYDLYFTHKKLWCR